MNRQIFKFLKAGVAAGIPAAIIEMGIAAALLEYTGQTIDAAALLPGGLTVGSVTLVLTVVISAVIAGRRQKI